MNSQPTSSNMSSAPTSNSPSLPPSIYYYDTNISAQSLGLSIAIYLSMGVVTVGLFVVFRKCFARFYSPRRYYVSEKEAVRELPNGWLNWVVPLFSAKADKIILKKVGLDAYVSIRIIGLGWKLMGVFAVPAMGILVPVYATQGPSSSSASTDFMTLTSIVNVSQGTRDLLWLSLVFSWAFTAVGIFLVHQEFKHLIPIQREFYLYKHRATYTVLVERIPKELSSRKALFRYFESIFPNSVLRIDLIPLGKSAQKLQDLVEERTDVITGLERACLEEHAIREENGGVLEPDQAPREIVFEKGKRWMSLRGLCCGKLCHLLGHGTEVNAVSYYEEELERLNEEIAAQQEALRHEIYTDRDKKYSYASAGEDMDEQDLKGGVETWAFSLDKADEAEWLLGEHSFKDAEDHGEAAFVTFRSKMVSTAIGRGMETEHRHFIIVPSPEPSDIHWPSLAKNPRLEYFTSVLVFLLNLVLLGLFGVLTSTISLTTNLKSLRTQWPELDAFLTDYPGFILIVEQIAPLLIVIAFAIVPPVLNLILELRFDDSLSRKDDAFFRYYTVFLITQIFLFFQISGAILEIFRLSWQDPKELLKLLAAVVPNNATFFMQYLVIRAFWVLPSQLIRLGDIAVAFFVRPICCGYAKTPREMRNDKCGCRTFGFAGDAWHGIVNAQIMLAITMGVTYSVISPFVLLFAWAYLGLALLNYRYQYLYVYVKVFEAGGSSFLDLGTFLLFAFLLMQVTLMGIFSLHRRVAEALLMLIPMVVTVAYMYFLRSQNDLGTFYITLSDARKFDIHKAVRNHELRPLDYRLPSLREPAAARPATVQSMLSELRVLQTPPPVSHLPGADSDSDSSEPSRIDPDHPQGAHSSRDLQAGALAPY